MQYRVCVVTPAHFDAEHDVWGLIAHSLDQEPADHFLLAQTSISAYACEARRRKLLRLVSEVAAGERTTEDECAAVRGSA